MIRPFSSGSQFADWEASNCERCTKYFDEEHGEFRCPWQEALITALFDTGEITDNVAAGIGADKVENRARYVWQCASVDWTEEWKAEYMRLHPHTAK